MATGYAKNAKEVQKHHNIKCNKTAAVQANYIMQQG